MIDLLLSLFIWAIIGAIPGFYAAYAKGHNPRNGIIAGAIVGLLVGEAGFRLGIVASQGSAVVIIIGLAIIAGLFLPTSDYIEKQATLQQRTTFLAYLLIVPTAVIVLGIVVFPLIWNIIFSLRPIEMADLRDVELFDFSDASLENFDALLGFRIDPVPCERDDTGECVVDEEGNIVYEQARRVYDDYRGYREVGAIGGSGGEEQRVLGLRDREFYPMILRTFLYTIASTILAIVFGLIAALVANDAFRGRNLFRGFILFPYIAPVISVAFVWQVLLRQDGIVNGVIGTEIPFLNTSETFLGVSVPLLMVILFQAWRYFPFAFLFLLARIQAVPDDMYEAAKVDGASPSERLWFITLPQLRAVVGTLFLLRFIWTFNKFDDVFLLTGMNPDTKVIPVAIFEALWAENDVGKASATAVVMAIILAFVLLIYFRFFLVEDEG